MGRPMLVPSKSTLERWQREGLTHQLMVERHERESGIRVTRIAISVAFVRYGLADTNPRYSEQLPWRVHTAHATHYAARMLRLLGRREHDPQNMNANERARLQSWLAFLERESVIVGYAPRSVEGFHYIPSFHKDHAGASPIRRHYLKGDMAHLRAPEGQRLRRRAACN